MQLLKQDILSTKHYKITWADENAVCCFVPHDHNARTMYGNNVSRAISWSYNKQLVYCPPPPVIMAVVSLRAPLPSIASATSTVFFFPLLGFLKSQKTHILQHKSNMTLITLIEGRFILYPVLYFWPKWPNIGLKMLECSYIYIYIYIYAFCAISGWHFKSM